MLVQNKQLEQQKTTYGNKNIYKTTAPRTNKK